MKIFQLLLLMLSIGCTSNSDFQKYVIDLEKIKTPIVIRDNFDVEKSLEVDIELFKKYKHISSSAPIGILWNEPNMVITLEYAVADNGYAPILMIYNNKGTKLDSLYLLAKTGYGDFGKTIETAKINTNKTISIIDSTWTWKVDDNYEPIDSTILISTNKKRFTINNDGVILNTGG